MNRGRHKKKPTKYPNTWLTKILTDEQLDLLFKRAIQQGNNPSLQDIEQNLISTKIIRWDRTPEGWEYWSKILSKVNTYENDRC